MMRLFNLKLKYCIFFVLLVILWRCKTTDQENSNNRISFKNAISQIGLLQDISDSIRFTFLEKDKDNPVGEISKYKISKNYILLVDQQQTLFVFNKNGDLISVISKKGKGPSEYVNIEDFTTDLEENHVFLLASSSGKVIKYDIHGDFVKEYPILFNHATNISRLNNDHFAIYQSARFSKKFDNVFIVDSNFQLVSSIKDSGGAILKDLPYLLDVHWYEHETNTYYKEVLCDTIFTISRNHHSLPHFILDFEKKKMPYKYYTNTKYYQMGAHKFYQLGNIIESGEYVFFQILFNRKSNYFIYHKTDKLLFDLGNRNPNHDLVQTFWPEYIDDEDIMYCLVNSIELTNMLSPSNTTQVIRQTLELNDNPVLISSKLKH